MNSELFQSKLNKLPFSLRIVLLKGSTAHKASRFFDHVFLLGTPYADGSGPRVYSSLPWKLVKTMNHEFDNVHLRPNSSLQFGPWPDPLSFPGNRCDELRKQKSFSTSLVGGLPLTSDVS